MEQFNDKAFSEESPHITDDQLVEYSLELLFESEREYVNHHLMHCSACRAEMDRLERLSVIWRSEERMARMTIRVREAIGNSVSA